MTCAVAFGRTRHALTVPVRVGDIDTRFILYTGVGLNLISEALAERAGCRPDGSTYTGKRMSGQPVTIPLGTVSSLELGDHASTSVPTGIFDMHALAGIEGVEGFLSLTYFRNLPVTVDYAAGLVVLEDDVSLTRRAEAGAAVAVRLDYDSCSTDLLLGLDLPSGRRIMAEVDTGSDIIVLDESMAADAGIDLGDPAVRVREGSDETGYTFKRYFTSLSGDISISGIPRYRVAGPSAVFQKIIYEGLVGDPFLRNFTTTYDLPNQRMIFGPPHAVR